MERNLKEALRHRRSYYELTPRSPIDDAQIEEIVRFAVKHVPSAFNSQSARLVLLLHEHHKAFWELVKRTLQAIVPEKAFVATEKKIDGSFASGYGTVLYFEDTEIVKGLQKQFPLYADNFPRLVRTYFGNAPAGGMDDARRRRIRSLAPTLQSADRQRSPRTLGIAGAMAANSPDAVRHSGRRTSGEEFRAVG